MLARRAGAAAVLALSVSTALAQEPPPPNHRPTTDRIHHPLIGVGIATTWDGRVFFVDDYKGSFAIHVFRPEKIVLGNGGPNSPWFFAGAFSETSINGADPGTIRLGPGDPAPDAPALSGGAIAVLPADGFADNPFRSDVSGNADPNGAFETYEVSIFMQWLDPAILGRRRARIVIANPRTADARVQSADWHEPFRTMHRASGEKLRGIEPTLPFDGHLMILQGTPANDGGIGAIMYATNETAGAVDGWTEPRSITQLYDDRDRVVAGVKIGDRWPIARFPIVEGDGAPVTPGAILNGAYPWLTLDGTELVFIAGDFRTTTVVGRWTGGSLRAIDGRINWSRDGSHDRQFYASPGAVPSFWRQWRDSATLARPPLPTIAARPILPLFGGASWDYCEVTFDDHEDGDYVLALRMNELRRRKSETEWEIDTTRTPDTSGRFNTGAIEGARFSQEVFGKDENAGWVGQALWFSEKDRVRVARAPSLVTPDALTVEFALQRLEDMDQDGENRYLVVASGPGAWSVVLEEDGRVQASVVVNGELRRSGKLGPAIAKGEWAHVAFTYDAATGSLGTYLRGVLAGESTFAPGRIDELAGDVGIGPAAEGQPASTLFTDGRPVVAIDEVRVSRVARTKDEIARAAYLPPAPIVAPPAASPDQVELGRMLFFDPRLSRDRSTSCATCHDPAHHYTDARPRAIGLANKVLRRNSPTVVNRLASTLQFWDGRAASLEEQALAPIENPDEMGFNVDEAAARLAAIDDYRARFAKVFGKSPDRASIASALAGFERALAAGGSAADRFEAGDASALDDASIRGRRLFRGKARCAACHFGSNFTDEGFHATAQTDGADSGRGAITNRTRDANRFKTPSLRDVALTGPYLHDGSAATLEAVIDGYDRGGKQGQPIDDDVKPLALTGQEKSDLVAYLRALTSTNTLPGAPALPPDPPAPPRRRAVHH